MYITYNIAQSYQIDRITNETLTVSKNYINNIANRILKSTPLITAMIQVGMVFSLGSSVESAVLHNGTTRMIMPEFDEINNGAYDTFVDCGPFAFTC